MKKHYDIIIVGGGMVGSSLALALAKTTRFSIAVLEASTAKEEWMADCYHHRVSALSLSSIRFLQYLAIWPKLLAKRVSPFRRIEVCSQPEGAYISFDSKEIAESALGFIIENNLLQTVLEDALKNFANVTILRGVQLVNYQEKEQLVSLSDEAGCIYTSHLVFAADGMKSWLRNQIGIAVKVQSYDQKAIVTTVRTALPHRAIARQVFLPEGPLAFLPLKDDYLCSIVWSLPTALAEQYLKLDECEFKQRLAAAFNNQLGEILDIERRHAFTLQAQDAKAYVNNRVVLLGDAAHVMHPLAGQGVNLGFLDVASLAELLVDAEKDIKNHNITKALTRYQRWRKAENTFLLTSVDYLKAFFANQHHLIKMIRKYGLITINKTNFIKNIIIKQAVGNRPGLPRMTQRGEYKYVSEKINKFHAIATED